MLMSLTAHCSARFERCCVRAHSHCRALTVRAVRMFDPRAVGGATLSGYDQYPRGVPNLRRGPSVPSRAVFTPVAARDFYPAAVLRIEEGG